MRAVTYPAAVVETLTVVAVLGLATAVGAARTSTPWPVPEAARAAANPIKSDPAAVAAGEKIYFEKCVMCHGEAGLGDGISSTYLQVPPGDLTKLATQTDGELHWKIARGRRPMPGFAGKLEDRQIWQLVQFVRALAPSKTTPKKVNPESAPGEVTNPEIDGS